MKDPGGMKELGQMAHRGASRTGMKMNQTILGEMRTLESQIGILIMALFSDRGDGMMVEVAVMARSLDTFVRHRCKHANHAMTVMAVYCHC